MSFDVVVPVGPKDLSTIQACVQGLQQNIAEKRSIFLVTSPSLLPREFDHVKILDEKTLFPFTKETIAALFQGNQRSSWYFQQLLKLYSVLVIPGILPRVLIVDADTIFLRPTTFLTTDNQMQLNVGREYHLPYFEHMSTLVPGLGRTFQQFSGITHHMLFDREIVKDLFHKVETRHEKPFWEVFCRSVDPKNISGSGASEYELYFNFALRFHPEKVILRPLRWENVKTLSEPSSADYVSCHWYLREK